MYGIYSSFLPLFSERNFLKNFFDYFSLCAQLLITPITLFWADASPQLELWHFSQFESLHGCLLYPVPFLTVLFKPSFQRTTFSVSLSLIPHDLPFWVLKLPSQLFMLSVPIVVHPSGWISSDSVQVLISPLYKDVILLLLRLLWGCPLHFT